MSVGPAHAYAVFSLRSASSFSCSSVSSFPKDVHFWHGLACLKQLPEGSFAFSHINSVSGDFYSLIVPSLSHHFVGGAVLWPLDRAASSTPLRGRDRLWMAFSLPLFGGSSDQCLLEELLMACLVLKVLAFL